MLLFIIESWNSELDSELPRKVFYAGVYKVTPVTLRIGGANDPFELSTLLRPEEAPSTSEPYDIYWL
jgi:hypothetical protein